MSMSLESLMRESVLEPTEVGLGTQLLSFLVIGAGAAMGFVVLSRLMLSAPLGLSSWVVSSMCYGLFVLLAYAAHRRFSFHSSAPHGRALAIYLAVQVSGLALAIMFSWLAYGVFALPTTVAALSVICLTAGVNFMVLKAWAFRSPPA